MKHKAIAICGYIGSGKSTVGNILRNCGCEVIDCDKLARQVADMPSTVDAVRDLMGDGDVLNGKLNRPYIRLRILTTTNCFQNTTRFLPPPLSNS